MINKKEFTKLMKEFISIRKDEDNLNKAFKKFEPDFNYISFGRYENLLVKTLELAMDDTSEWIVYWVYELNFGKEAKKNTVQSKKGKNIPIKTISDLYNLLTKK